MMKVIRHPKLAADICLVARHYSDVSERMRTSFWAELDQILGSIQRNPSCHHFDACGLRRANMRKFPYHLLYEFDADSVFLVVLRHDSRHPDFGLNRRR